MSIPLFQRVIKVGNALAVILPADIVRGLEIQRGTIVAVSATRADLVNIKLFADYELEQMRIPLPEIES